MNAAEKRHRTERQTAVRAIHRRFSFLFREKEVIQPHLPVRLPCYDFTPLTRRTFESGPRFRLSCLLRVPPARMV